MTTTSTYFFPIKYYLNMKDSGQTEAKLVAKKHQKQQQNQKQHGPTFFSSGMNSMWKVVGRPGPTL